MDSEEADHSFGSVRLTEGDIDNSELSSEEEIIEGAVGFSPTQNHWLVYAVNEPAYVEETDRKPGNNFNLSEKRISSTSTCENTPEGLRERPVYSQRRHSFSGAPVRRQSLPGFDESGLCSCRSPLARQASVLRRSDNGMMRQVSVPSFFSNRQNLIRVRRNSLQLDRGGRNSLQLDRGGIGLAPSGSSSTRNQYAIMNPNDSARMGSDLFMMYLREEIERSEIQSPPEGLPQFSRNTLENGEFMQMGTHLRYMADEFSKSDLRERVRQRAGSVNLSNLDFSSFSDLLFGTFQEGGMTSERVLVLFTFCADLAIRALREKLQARFYELTQWSQQYIMSWLSPWVQYHGGWAVVLEHSVSEVYKAAVIGMCFMGMIAFWVYIRNNCR